MSELRIENTDERYCTTTTNFGAIVVFVPAVSEELIQIA